MRRTSSGPSALGFRWTPTRFSIAIAVLGGLFGAVLATIATWPAFPETGFQSDPTPSMQSATPSARPSEDTAGSVAYAEDFDAIAIGEEVGGWSATSGAVIDIAAMPTAVDRSLRVTSGTRGAACRALDMSLGSLTAEFMLDGLPPSGEPVVSVAFADGSIIGVTVSVDGAALTDTASPVPIEARTWYRWSVAVAGDTATMALSQADETVLAQVELPLSDAHAARFCLTSVASGRAYLDTLAVEAQ